MTWERIRHLTWVRKHYGTCKIDLARSNLAGITAADLGLALDRIELDRVRPGPLPLQERLAARYDVPASCIRLTCGSTMALFAVFEALLERGDEVLLENPNYEPLYANLHRKRVAIKPIERRFETGWEFDLESLQRRISRNTRAVVLTNLHNPTGAATNPDKLVTLGHIARDYDATVVVDEVYLDSGPTERLRPAVQCGTNLVSIGSLSKSYGLGGLRVGWVATRNEALMQRLGTIVDDYLWGAPPLPSMAIGALAVERADAILTKARGIIETGLKILSGWVSRHNAFSWVKPAGGTVAFIRLPPGVDDMRLSELLMERFDTLVTPGEFFWKKGFVRISYGCDSDMLRAGLRNVQAAVDALARG